MEKVSSSLKDYIKLEHRETGNLYAATREDWNKFRDEMSNGEKTNTLPDLKVTLLIKNRENEYDLSDTIEIINYSKLKGVLIKIENS